MSWACVKARMIETSDRLLVADLYFLFSDACFSVFDLIMIMLLL